MAAAPNKLTYQPFSSILNPGFWQTFSNIKLDKLRLSEEPHCLTGTYACNLASDLPCLASFDHNSLSETPATIANKFTSPLYGKLVCMNLMQDFIDYDKKAFLSSLGRDMWAAICDGSALERPEESLSKCGLLVYADLKKYKYFYWFSFPALNYPKDVFIKSHTRSSRPLSEQFSSSAMQSLLNQYEQPTSARPFQRGYFIVAHDRSTHETRCAPLTQYRELAKQGLDIYFAFSDPSADAEHPGWPLRNLLALIAVQFQLTKVALIRIRRGPPVGLIASGTDLDSSMFLTATFELDDALKAATCLENLECPLVTGWERNESQQMAPRRVNLESVLNPKKIAEDAVNLNLRLMKWRLMPTLDLDGISSAKCLLLGCGTLGCHIARGLLAWGIKHISLVDNSKISYSNPVRQSLYSFEDCAQTMGKGGSYKAEAAAASLRRIHPTVDVESHVFSIPMPGHHVTTNELEQTKSDVKRLEQLIKSHDAIFLLMDTRESRWLPSVIALSERKLVINAAIGFDTFLLQRYGIRDYSACEQTECADQSDTEPQSTSGVCEPRRAVKQLGADRLGCYFCNDIVAPGDSTLDRTLDQQCTVSRPGVSMMVSALAVELLASIMSSSRGPLTPAPVESTNDPWTIYEEDYGSDLGIVPHSIRGNLNRYHIYMPTSPAFNKCSACSRAVVGAYQEQGFEFLQRVFEDPSYLEEIAGLKELQNVSDDVLALDSDEILFEDSV